MRPISGGPRRTVLRTLRADGPALAVRRTGTPSSPVAQVHLVGTAAGPMGGDLVEVRVRVGPGAHLDLQGVAASVVLPGRDQARSRLRLDVEVAAGGLLTCTLPPVVVTGAAEHQATTVVRLGGDGRLRLAEHVRLGRHDEPGGWWRGHVDVTRDGSPVLRQSTTLGDDPGMRDLRTVLDTAATDHASATHDTVVMPLAAGGTLTVTLGATTAAEQRAR
ncbi:urease accessory protein UreD [Jannaschia sp. R86511]|uniref:urease accessory protein UreD n=1 Tax=Jannaschia sp. R86511 TaxID=3093853 RepID=UPI0036D3C9DF